MRPFPPEPPPPPKISQSNISEGKVQGNANKLMTLLWPFADDVQSEIRHVLNRKLYSKIQNQNNSGQSMIVSFYAAAPSLLQDGPMCGLVALQIAAECLNVAITASELLKIAQNEGWTKQAENLSALVCKHMTCNAELISSGLNEDDRKILTHLMKGQPVLVPYDSDGNHEPCLKKGHKAHWAVLLGVVMLINEMEGHDQAQLIDILEYHRDEQFPHLIHVQRFKDTEHLISMDYLKSVDLYVYAKHGKSKYLDLWNYKHLTLSNDNLVEISAEILQDRDSYVIPDDGITGGLKSKAILISR